MTQAKKRFRSVEFSKQGAQTIYVLENHQRCSELLDALSSYTLWMALFLGHFWLKTLNAPRLDEQELSSNRPSAILRAGQDFLESLRILKQLVGIKMQLVNF